MDKTPRHFTRRQALALIAAALATTAAHGAGALALEGQPTVGAPAMADTFAAFCDTLVPADALSPAASALGVPARILAEVDANPQLQRLVAFSMAWLDQAAGGAFAGADEGLRDAILEAMSKLPWEAPQRRCFDLMRDLVMGYYYSRPEALAGMAVDRPPQPAGYFMSLE
jgi:Gluconate 2-dehydrogenase subunit 3